MAGASTGVPNVSSTLTSGLDRDATAYDTRDDSRYVVIFLIFLEVLLNGSELTFYPISNPCSRNLLVSIIGVLQSFTS